MSEKYVIFGATGSIGSSLAEQLKNSGNNIHLVGRNESELSSISEKLGCSHTVADVLEDGFIEKVKSDISEIKGLAYCVGSIDLKPLRMVNEQDFQKCMKLNLYSAVEAIKGYQESLKKNKGSIVLFSTVAAQRGFTNHAIIASAKADVSEIKGIAYCVGSIDLKPLRMVTEQDFNKCMKLNLYSAVEAIKGYQENLKKNKGSIVLFSTVAAQRGFTNHAIIASAKSAVEGLTVSLAAEFAPNIRVNCVAPSLTKSKIAEPMLKNTTIAEGIAKAHPLKRLGEGKDSAALAKFLLTEDSSWVTGQIIAVDGGRSKLS